MKRTRGGLEGWRDDGRDRGRKDISPGSQEFLRRRIVAPSSSFSLLLHDLTLRTKKGR